MTLNQLLYFQAVAKYEHFRLAAASLNISQPSLSRSIANLEEELGIILFERKGRTVTLTKYGRFFLEHANRILSDVRLAEKQMKKLSGSSGHVDIAYVFPLAAQYIPRNVRRFLAKSNNSKISFNFHQTYTGEMRPEIRKIRRDLRLLRGKRTGHPVRSHPEAGDDHYHASRPSPGKKEGSRAERP